MSGVVAAVAELLLLVLHLQKQQLILHVHALNVNGFKSGLCYCYQFVLVSTRSLKFVL